jgi:hypothetical protein
VLAEHPLDRDDVGPVALDPALDLGPDGQQPLGDGRVGRGGDDADVHTPHGAPTGTVDDPEPAPGQSRVDAEHPHTVSSRANSRSRGQATGAVTGPDGGAPSAGAAFP